jgi:hypothetical protein
VHEAYGDKLKGKPGYQATRKTVSRRGGDGLAGSRRPVEEEEPAAVEEGGEEGGACRQKAGE